MAAATAVAEMNARLMSTHRAIAMLNAVRLLPMGDKPTAW